MIIRFSNEMCNMVIPSEHTTITEDGVPKMIRLIKGSDEVLANKQPKEYSLREPFKTGFANIRDGESIYYQTEVTDTSIINYLKELPYWGKYIVEYDPIAESKAQADSAEKQFKIMERVMKLTDEDLLALGYALIGNKALGYLKGKNIAKLKVEVYQKTQEEPEIVESLLDDKSKVTRLFLGLAFAKGVLRETEAGTSVSWGEDYQLGSKLISVPRDTTPIDALLEYFTEPDGREILKVINTRLKNKANIPVEEEADKKKSK